MGSNPIFSATLYGLRRGIAQLVEQWSPKPRAEGSNPSAPARQILAFGGTLSANFALWRTKLSDDSQIHLCAHFGADLIQLKTVSFNFHICDSKYFALRGNAKFSQKIYHGGVAQLGERQVRNLEARGSNPVCSIYSSCVYK